MISFGGSGRHFREILVGRRHSWQQLSVSLWVQKLRFTSKWIHNYFSLHNVTAQWVYNLTIWLYDNFTAFISVHSGFRACFPPHSGLTKHKVFTIGSKHVFYTSPSSPHRSHTDSPIHQFTNSPWVHIDLHTRTQMLSFWSAECEPTVGRTRVERTQSQGLEVNELFSVLPTSCPWNVHRRIKLTIHPSGSIFPVFIAPALFALWDHA